MKKTVAMNAGDIAGFPPRVLDIRRNERRAPAASEGLASVFMTMVKAGGFLSAGHEAASEQRLAPFFFFSACYVVTAGMQAAMRTQEQEKSLRSEGHDAGSRAWRFAKNVAFKLVTP